MRIALVGCGRISRKHIEAIASLEGRCSIECLVDLNDESIGEALDKIKDCGIAAKVSPKCYKDFESLLEDIRQKKIKIDLAVLTTPSGLHSEQTCKLANLGIHICTEKPMATNLKDGLRMKYECDKNNVRLFVVKQNRLNKTVKLVKEQIDSGKFGKIAMVTCNVFWQRPQSYYDLAEWRGTKEMDGGCLMNQASHYIDLLDWLVGPIDTVSATIETIDRNIDVEDTAALHLKWKRGCIGTMAVTMLTYDKNMEGSITILGTKGSVKIGGTALNKIETWKFEEKSENDKKVEDANYMINDIYGLGHLGYYDNMLRVFEEDDDPVCDGNDGLRSLELLEACYLAAAGKPIKLPLDSR